MTEHTIEVVLEAIKVAGEGLLSPKECPTPFSSAMHSGHGCDVDRWHRFLSVLADAKGVMEKSHD